MKQCLVGPETIRMLNLGHPWVIADRYTAKWPKCSCGELIVLVDERRQMLATALCDPRNRVIARILPERPQLITAFWLEQQLRQAHSLRSHARLGDSNCYRLVNAEGDGLPGLTVDRYGDYLMVQLYTDAWQPYLPLLTMALTSVFSPAGIYLKYRPQQTRELEAKGKGQQENSLLSGQHAPLPLIVKENGLNYLVTLRYELHTGLFPDQRRNRREVMKHSTGRKILNLFAFTGAFSLAAAAAQAECVTSVDVSEKYLNIARKNFAANTIDPQQHEWIVGDVFVEMDKLQQQKRRFDMVLFDPPSFSTTKKSRFSTQGGTSQLVMAAMNLLNPGGLLVCSSNHQKVALDEYLKELRRGALAVGGRLQAIFIGGQPEDFPCDVAFPEGRYLKFVISVRS